MPTHAHSTDVYRSLRVARGAALGSLHALCLLLALLVAGVASAGEGQDRVRRDVERFVRANLAPGAEQGGRISIEVPALAAFDIDRARFPGPLRTELSTRSERPLGGQMAVTVALYAGERLAKRGIVTPAIRREASAYVAVRDLPRGTILEAADFRRVARDGSRLPRDAVRSLEGVEGLRTKRMLRQDRVVRTSQLERVPIVERGDRVQIVLKAGPLEVNAIGKAQEKGASGDWIRVVNVDSRRELSGRLDREGRVHVAF